MEEMQNHIRSNIKYVFHKLFKECVDLELPESSWAIEKYQLYWDGQKQMQLLGLPNTVMVTEGEITLDSSIQNYYDLPYFWLKKLSVELS